MKPWKFLLLGAIMGIFCADGARGQNSVNINIGGKSWTFALNPTVLKLTCDKTALGPGEQSTCIVTLDLPAPAGGWAITPYTADAPLVLSPGTLTINAGSTTGTFNVLRPQPAASTTPLAPK